MGMNLRSFAKPAALGVTAAALVGGLAIGAAAWPEDAPLVPKDGTRPAAAPDTSLTGIRVKGLMPLMAADYVDKIHDAQAAEALAALFTAYQAEAAASGGACGGTLSCIAQCESGGNYSTNTGNGYYGAYQFSQSTWNAVGGSGVPSDAPPEEQDMRAQMLYERQGSSPWPSCG
jgi:Transglycosylase-like domain